MAADEELRARAVLAEMQMRIARGPHAALSIPQTATAEQVRAAFLQLTKQFHPARFGRMSGEIHRLANEVFLGIKDAHDQLTKQLGSSGRVMTVRSSSTGVLGPGDSQRIGLVPRAGSPAPIPPAQLARGTDRATLRPGTPNDAHETARMRAKTPSTAGEQRTGSQPLPRVGTPPPRTTAPLPRLGTPPGNATRATSPVPRLGTPAPRIGTPPLRPESPSTVRPTSPVPRLGTPPQRSASPRSNASQPIRYSSLSRAGTPFDEERELAAAMALLREQNWTAARQAFHALAARMPQSRQYRALLCYARGRETQGSGRVDDAVLEYQRALQLDPELEIAKQALRDLGRKSRW